MDRFEFDEAARRAGISPDELRKLIDVGIIGGAWARGRHLFTHGFARSGRLDPASSDILAFRLSGLHWSRQRARRPG